MFTHLTKNIRMLYHLILSIPQSHSFWNLRAKLSTFRTASLRKVFFLCRRQRSCILRMYPAWISMIWSRSLASFRSCVNSRPILCRICKYHTHGSEHTLECHKLPGSTSDLLHLKEVPKTLKIPYQKISKIFRKKYFKLQNNQKTTKRM